MTAAQEQARNGDGEQSGTDPRQEMFKGVDLAELYAQVPFEGRREAASTDTPEADPAPEAVDPFNYSGYHPDGNGPDDRARDQEDLDRVPINPDDAAENSSGLPLDPEAQAQGVLQPAGTTPESTTHRSPDTTVDLDEPFDEESVAPEDLDSYTEKVGHPDDEHRNDGVETVVVDGETVPAFPPLPENAEQPVGEDEVPPEIEAQATTTSSREEAGPAAATSERAGEFQVPRTAEAMRRMAQILTERAAAIERNARERHERREQRAQSGAAAETETPTGEGEQATPRNTPEAAAATPETERRGLMARLRGMAQAARNFLTRRNRSRNVPGASEQNPLSDEGAEDPDAATATPDTAANRNRSSRGREQRQARREAAKARRAERAQNRADRRKEIKDKREAERNSKNAYIRQAQAAARETQRRAKEAKNVRKRTKRNESRELWRGRREAVGDSLASGSEKIGDAWYATGRAGRRKYQQTKAAYQGAKIGWKSVE